MERGVRARVPGAWETAGEGKRKGNGKRAGSCGSRSRPPTQDLAPQSSQEQQRQLPGCCPTEGLTSSLALQEPWGSFLQSPVSDP